MAFPTKAERQACWKARDKYWECLDLNNEDKKACLRWKEEFETNCSASWVKHFERKRKYEKFKGEMDKSGWEFTNEEKS